MNDRRRWIDVNNPMESGTRDFVVWKWMKWMNMTGMILDKFNFLRSE